LPLHDTSRRYGVFLHKIIREPHVPYIHLLVDYHFGFTKRALSM
jgi:hypothetical protein